MPKRQVTSSKVVEYKPLRPTKQLTLSQQRLEMFAGVTDAR
jgi:hypothetical protein